jgi:isopenicillin N synthase-like dioxygenase
MSPALLAQNVRFDQLPLIDLHDLRFGDHTAFSGVADKIGHAAREIGFFRVFNHGIPPAVINEVYKMAALFFAKPDSFKQEYYIGHSRNHRGYVPFSEKGDYSDEMNRSYEAFDLGLDLPKDDPDYLSGNRVLGPNVWPALAGFKEAVSRYYSKISILGQLICSALELHLGLPDCAMTAHMSKPVSQLRLLHYVRYNCATDPQSINMGAHTDYECLTLLHTRNRGLQVMTREDLWIDVPVDPKMFVVNIGDMLEAWSNGLLRSTPHRVLNLTPERFSIPYFVATNYDTLIKPFPQLLGAGQVAKYNPVIAGEHLKHMLTRDFPYLREQLRRVQPHLYVATATSVVNSFEKRINGVLLE